MIPGIVAFISVLIFVAILASIIIGIVIVVRRGGHHDELVEDANEHPGAPVRVERVVVYVLTFAGLMAVLFALATLASLAFYPFWPDASKIMTPNDAKSAVSASVAALIVGVPIWLGLWRVAQRRLARSPGERNTLERRLFLGAVFAVTAIVALFGLAGTITAIFMLLTGEGSQNAQLRDLMSAGTRTLVYGAAWWFYARIWSHEHDRRALDWTHDLALYVVTGIAGAGLFIGLTGAGREILSELQSTNGNTLFGQPTLQTWENWAGAVGGIVASGVTVAAALRYDFLRDRARIVRVIWLYAMLLWIVPSTIIASADAAAETLRRAFGFAPNNWSFLADTLPIAVVGACFWLATWLLARREANLEGAPEQAGVILYPRRLGIALLDAVGLGMLAFGVVAGIWVGIDAILTSHNAVGGGGWWRELTSWSLAVGGIGALIWVPAWTRLQRAAAVSPEYERGRWERRWLITGVTLAATLIVIGFTVALLYQVLRGILGTADANTLSDALRFFTAALVAAAVAGYHGLILRREARLRAAVPGAGRVYIRVMLTPGAEHTLSELARRTGLKIGIAGYVKAEDVQPVLHLSEIEERLAMLGTGAAPNRALLLLRADGGQVIAYTIEALPGARDRRDRIDVDLERDGVTRTVPGDNADLLTADQRLRGGQNGTRRQERGPGSNPQEPGTLIRRP